MKKIKIETCYKLIIHHIISSLLDAVQAENYDFFKIYLIDEVLRNNKKDAEKNLNKQL